MNIDERIELAKKMIDLSLEVKKEIEEKKESKEKLVFLRNIEKDIKANEETITLLEELKTMRETTCWIPVKTRPLTEEEKEEYADEGFEFMYDCPLPEHGQDVLITTKYGYVEKTTFFTDCGDYFENWDDEDDVLAWMPLPKPYKEEGAE